VLNSYRSFVRWRREHPALSFGDIRFLDAPQNTMAFIREYGQSRVLSVFNFNRSDVDYDLPLFARAEVLSGHGFAPGSVQSGRARIPGYAAFFTTLQ
jgi:alpha-glucosidase